MNLSDYAVLSVLGFVPVKQSLKLYLELLARNAQKKIQSRLIEPKNFSVSVEISIVQGIKFSVDASFCGLTMTPAQLKKGIATRYTTIVNTTTMFYRLNEDWLSDYAANVNTITAKCDNDPNYSPKLLQSTAENFIQAYSRIHSEAEQK